MFPEAAHGSDVALVALISEAGLTQQMLHAEVTQFHLKVHAIGQRYFHFLHHRYLECNYSGDGTVPMDR